MSTVDEIWSRFYEPTQMLRQNALIESWDVNCARVLDDLGGDSDPVVAELVRKLDELTAEQRADLLGGDDIDSLVYTAPQGAVGGADQPDAEEDDGVWAGFLAANGPAWDGSEKSLPAFREWFAYYAADAG